MATPVQTLHPGVTFLPDNSPSDDEICGETFDHDVIDYGDGYYRCRRCDAEWSDEPRREDRA